MSQSMPFRIDAEELNRLILRSVVDHAIITLDHAGCVTSWNEGAEQILGWTEQEIIGQSADVFFTPEDVAQDRPEFEMARALAEGRAEDERWHRKKNGQRFWASGLMMPLRSEDQAEAAADGESHAARGFVKIFRDRTFHHEAGQRIARLESRASLAMRRSGTVGVFDLDTLEDIIVSDAICADLHDVPAAEAAKGVGSETFLSRIHPEDAPRVREALHTAIRDGSDIDQVYRTAAADPLPTWIHSQAAVQFDTDGRAARLSGIVVDITAQHERAQMQETQLNFIDQVRDFRTADEIAAFASRTIAQALHAARAGHGYIEADGDTVDVRADWSSPGHDSVVGRHTFSTFGHFASVLHKGETVILRDVTSDTRVPDPAALVGIHVRSLVNLPLMGKGQLKAILFVHDDRPRDWTADEIRFMQAIFDRTYAEIDRLRYETERDIMAAELAHRMKNMLTIAQVVVSQSLRNVSDVPTARDAIAARLRALGEAQNVLTRVEHQNAAIQDVVASALRPYASAEDRITATGDPISLSPQQVLGLSLALHELGTNAAKYGALSDSTGRVAITWRNRDGQFHLEWRESMGPTVTGVASEGFGSTILNKVVGGYFHGETTLHFDPAGVVFTISGRL